MKVSYLPQIAPLFASLSHASLTSHFPARGVSNITIPVFNSCPLSCQIVGPDPSNWTHIHELEDLTSCPQTLLFDFNIDNDLTANSVMRTCTGEAGDFPKAQPQPQTYQNPVAWAGVNCTDLEEIEESIISSSTCGATGQQSNHGMVAGPAGVLTDGEDATAAARLLASYISANPSCGSRLLFAQGGHAIVGLYSGAGVQKDSVAKVANDFATRAKKGTQVLQVCNADVEDQTVGLYAVNSVEQLSDVQAAVQQWVAGECMTLDGEPEKVDLEVLVAPESETTPANTTVDVLRETHDDAEKRKTCRTIQVANGDGCGSLARRCGISGAKFEKYNHKKHLCGTLMPKQYVCCSPGKLPDKTPKPQKDGTCAVHTVKSNDNCARIAAGNSLTVKEINEYNKASWAWAGCRRLQPGQKICLSKGNTPMPASVNGVICGPQKPGTKPPKNHFDGFDLAKLNPCPLNACCSGWGYCGTTAEFCTKAPADTGAPGSTKKGHNSCISHCGTDIVGNKKPPAQFRRVAYFEAFNVHRECLTMDVAEIPVFKVIPLPFPHFVDPDITHIHFAFAGITEDFQVHLDEGVKQQFERFVKMKAPWKKIVSFGGWAESTGSDTFQRYKDAVKPGNRDKFANAVVAFVEANKLDGVDFDWEYPGAPDIPGVPNGGKQEAVDYLEFLKIVESRLGDKSLSIPLPASFWYLKAFPVDKIADHVDYFIYMTYDLHGQWDYGNEFANPGCKAGNCLRSHVNKTETQNALSMITKAGVPASKIIVGVASYGRSFGMADPSCTGPMCKFTGSFRRSTAEPGFCTDTGGYISNAELAQIANSAARGIPGYVVKKWHDDTSDSDMMVYGTHGKATTWVAYMDDDTKAKRTKWIKGLNFGGASDWAIDLASWNLGVINGDEGAGFGDAFEDLPEMECISSAFPDTLEELQAKPDQIPAACRSEAIMSILMDQVDHAIAAYEEASEGYDEKFEYYVKWVKEGIDDSLEKFMFQDGRKYMDCDWSTNDDSGSGPCTEMEANFPDTHSGNLYITYTMRDADGFYKALMAQFGIAKSWIVWEDVNKPFPCTCPDGQPICQICQQPSGYFFKNYPQKTDDDSKINVQNPKKIVDAAIPNTDDLSDAMLDTYLQMRLGALDAEGTDVATAFSMPVFMLQDASTHMEQIKEIGGEVEEQEKKELIMNILTIVFAVIPFAGEAAAALGGATIIARGALMIGEAGNVALSIVEIVDDPSSAPFAILGIVGSLGAIRAAGGARSAFSKAAGARRALGPEKMKLFGAGLQKKDGAVQDILKSCGMKGST